MKHLLIVLAALAVMAFVTNGTVLAQAKPEFRFGFKALADQILDVVGEPLESEHSGSNGDSLQRTSTGLMVWRKADNWTAFTNGSRSWISGPAGVQDRANGERFSWESKRLDALGRSLDIASYQSARGGKWFSLDISTIPDADLKADGAFTIQPSPVPNRRNGRISPTLLAAYTFIQYGTAPSVGVSLDLLEKHAHTINALFLRSALVSFVDYPNNRVLGWNGTAGTFGTYVRDLVRFANQHEIPVFLEVNYSDYVPGAQGSGVKQLVKSDNVANTIQFLDSLKREGLRLDGITFGDEVEDPGVYAPFLPTAWNSDFIGRFANLSSRVKARFPALKVYAFDSYISAARGQMDRYFGYLQKIREAEIREGRALVDGLVYRESYVYMDQEGRVQDSQRILDDTESLYLDKPVYRYDTEGIAFPNPNRAYLPQLVDWTYKTFGRHLDIGITEYLPAGPVKVSETDTSKYADMDFILHFADVVGIYADQGLDFVSRFAFGNSPEHHKAYVDLQGNLGVNYPVQEQLAQHFKGDLLRVGRSVGYDQLKVKVYAARHGEETFIMILNKDASREVVVDVSLDGLVGLRVRLPRRSYTSLTVGDSVVISGIGD